MKERERERCYLIVAVTPANVTIVRSHDPARTDDAVHSAVRPRTVVVAIG